MKKYNRVSLLLGAEVFTLEEEISVSLPNEGTLTLQCKVSEWNFKELLSSGIQFAVSEDRYKLEVPYTAIVSLC